MKFTVYTGSVKIIWHICRLNKYKLNKETKSTYNAICFSYNAILFCYSICIEIKIQSINRALTPENVAEVRAFVLQSPCHSIFKPAQTLRLSKEVCKKFFTMIFKCIQTKWSWHNNSAKATLKLADYCVWKFIYFHLCAVNKQMFRYWAENNPCELHECPLHCPRVTVWCAVAEFGIWGPY